MQADAVSKRVATCSQKLSSILFSLIAGSTFRGCTIAAAREEGGFLVYSWWDFTVFRAMARKLKEGVG